MFDVMAFGDPTQRARAVKLPVDLAWLVPSESSRNITLTRLAVSPNQLESHEKSLEHNITGQSREVEIRLDALLSQGWDIR
jgi:hypothetical protein